MIRNVYALCDPDTEQVRYIGGTIRTVQQRLGEHIGLAKTGDMRPVCIWIRSLLADGKSPVAIRILHHNGRTAGIEHSLIGFLRGKYGADLLNVGTPMQCVYDLGKERSGSRAEAI